MEEVYTRLQKCLKSVRRKTDFKPQLALVLGSGLGDYAKSMRIVDTLDYCEIEDFPVSTVSGHAGRFLFGYVGEVPVVCMQGRVHYYEGYSMQEVVLPIRLMRLMGADVLFLTNAAGGIKTGMHAGDLMLITDQIASFVPSPLIGPNIEELGTRFPDMSEIYDRGLAMQVKKAAADMDYPIQEGTYLQLTGPQYESPKEVAMCRILGADAVGMSTACEAIAAKHMGMRIVGISCITNMASGISPVPLSHEEVKSTADRISVTFEKLVTNSILAIGSKNTKEQ